MYTVFLLKDFYFLFAKITLLKTSFFDAAGSLSFHLPTPTAPQRILHHNVRNAQKNV